MASPLKLSFNGSSSSLLADWHLQEAEIPAFSSLKAWSWREILFTGGSSERLEIHTGLWFAGLGEPNSVARSQEKIKFRTGGCQRVVLSTLSVSCYFPFVSVRLVL
ncbi:uncharacterized protein LOC120271625 [Dioscorea cayenensis subsp. rotundata]|uniref:Uncharacterized protein LOC120271625 n=1 Tax=Dioscorea cayennensis subsp. rotundata TaxID=55577 RepID=A0AB40C4Z1_DIOCR|nr:uncharacterized protein LOC120271625 [Dioscorea cayenensis subsp. rotundata]